MSTLPREPLTAEERALAAQLPRLHGSVEPGATLDARILAAARSAVAAPSSRRPRLRWIAPMAVAASLSLAVGLAWRLQPPAAGTAQPPMVEAAATDQQDARFITPPADDAQASEFVTPPPAAPPEQPRPASPRAVADAEAIPPGSDAAAAVASAPPPPPPAPAPASSAASAESTAASDMVAAPPVAQSSSQGMAKAARTSEAAREPAPAAAAPRPQANEAAMAESAAANEPQPFLADDPGEEVPPATADSPEVRDAWLRRIGELLAQGRSEDAKASLAEFRRRYPDAPLPPELQTLEP